MCAFFYIPNTPAHTSGKIMTAITSMTTKIKPWTKILEAPTTGPPLTAMGKRQTPTIIIVSDDLFVMRNEVLSRKCAEILQRTGDEKVNCCMTATMFNDLYESKDLSVIDFLTRSSFLTVSYKMLDRLIEFWGS